MSTTLSALGSVSGNDWETTIQQLMAIESQRSQLLITRKEESQTKLDLWAQIQSKVLALQSAAQAIDTRSEFAVKSASSSDSTRVAVSADASASEGAHSVEVFQLAKAHRIAAQGWADKNSTGVGDSGGDFVIEINGETITIADADLSSATTLEGLRDLINSSPDNDGLVTASILDDGSGTNNYRLVISADDTGTDNAITISSNPTNLDFSGTNIDEAETGTGWSGTSAITTSGTYSSTVNKSFIFTVAGSGTQTVGSGDITVNWVDSLGNSGSILIPNGYGGAPISVAEGVELSFAAGDLVAGDTFSVDVFAPGMTAAQDAHVAVDSVHMYKASNTVSDVLEGVTLDLLAAESGTEIDITIANDNDAVQEKIQSFIDAYNALMGDISTFTAYDEENETAAPLLGDGFLSTIRSRLAAAASGSMSGLPEGSLYDSLAVVGIRSSTKGLLTIDQSELSEALEDRFDDVVDLFTKSFSSGDGKIFFVQSNEITQGGEYSISVSYDANGNPVSATINGTAAVIDGRLIHAADGTPLEGLILGFTPPGSGPGTVDTTIRYGSGAAAALGAEATRFLDEDTGTIQYAIDDINDRIESLERQIDAWDVRLEATESRLRREFTTLETILSRLTSQSNYLSQVLG